MEARAITLQARACFLSNLRKKEPYGPGTGLQAFPSGILLAHPELTNASGTPGGTPPAGSTNGAILNATPLQFIGDNVVTLYHPEKSIAFPGGPFRRGLGNLCQAELPC